MFNLFLFLVNFIKGYIGLFVGLSAVLISLIETVKEPLQILSLCIGICCGAVKFISDLSTYLKSRQKKP
jgi:hypothetical protein